MSDLLNEYKDKILGIRIYTSDKNYFYLDDFIDLEALEPFLDEVDTGESDITPDGKAFLAAYYGYDALAEILVKRGKLKEYIGHFTVNELSLWLRDVEPLNTYNFIKEAKKKYEDTSADNPPDTNEVKS